MEVRQVQAFYLLLVHQNYIHSFLELVDDTVLQIIIEGDECLAGAGPSGMDVNNEKLGVPVIVVGKEVLCVSDHSGQLYLFTLCSHRV